MYIFIFLHFLKFLTTRGFPRGVIRTSLFLFHHHNHKTLSKVEKETKGEKENSSSPILYNVILAISEEMVGRTIIVYLWVFQGMYLRIFLGIQEYSRVSKDIQRKVHAWSRTESLFSLVFWEF